MTSTIKIPLAFGNDMSRILRGVAIIFMVCNHSMPGKVNAFAVPLFSFLVGYGYAFAKQRSLRHGLKRVWHLLKNYWLVLLGICLPTALITQYPFTIEQLGLNMLGLDPRLNFYSWYINFYFFAMMLMPLVSRWIDRRGLWITIGLSAVCGLAYWGLQYVPQGPFSHAAGVVGRWVKYMPIVLMGYYLAANKTFSHIQYRPGAVSAVLAVAGLVGIYFARGWHPDHVIDLLWAPAFAVCIAVIFGSFQLKPLRVFLTQMGLKSMHIWFLHALFFTHATKPVFAPLVDWAPWRWLFIVMVLALSFIMAIAVEWVMTLLDRASDAISNAIVKSRSLDLKQ